MNWGLILLGVFCLAFIVLVILAIRRMKGKSMDSSDDSSASEGREDAEDGEFEPIADFDQFEQNEHDEQEKQNRHKPYKQHSKNKTKNINKPENNLNRENLNIEENEESSQSASPDRKPEPTREKTAQRPDAPSTQEEKNRLTAGLAKTRGGFIARLSSLFRGKGDLDPALVDQVEEILFTADIGVATSQSLIDGLRQALGKKELKDTSAIWDHIKQRSATILSSHSIQDLDITRAKPFVILMVGVNGTGKTTTIGKLAARFMEEGHRVILAAGDTFRAAAVEQLEVWAQRAGCKIVKGKEGADPSSVIIEGLKEAQSSNADILLADTAGRLHTKVNLMEELQKIRRSLSKRMEGAPHETLLVLDATTGQNAIAQAKIFKDALDITGIVLTKLDGTAKGGVVLGICNELKLPVRFIGIGEKLEDLRSFNPEAFVEALYENAGSSSQFT